MDKYHLHWFTDEIDMHASSAIASYTQLLQLLNDNKTRQSRGVWFVLLSFLTHAAMVSKLLDPINKDNEERGRALRAHLEVVSGSAFLPRNARDNLEHIDERIDRWVQGGGTRVLEMVFEDRIGFNYIAEDEGGIRRVLIKDEMVFVSEDRNGKRIETALQPIFEELQILHVRCEYKLRTESPYNYRLAQALRNYEGK